MPVDYISDPYQRGQENFRADFELSDNPYPVCSNNFKQWEEGFLEAQSTRLGR